MTFGIYFHAEQALLRFVKETLAGPPSTQDEVGAPELVNGSVCVFACAAALEAIANALLQADGRLRHWDELRLQSKLDVLADFGGVSISWGELPWQDVGTLIRVRNWLAHFKEPRVGLTGAYGEWVEDDANRKPKLNPEEVLSIDSVRRYYDAVREVAISLARGVRQSTSYEYLVTEVYQNFQVG